MEQTNSFLGRGWSFPPKFSKASKGVIMKEDENDISDSLSVLLSTRLGERVMLPEYGCNMEDLLFESLDQTMMTYMQDLIATAIINHEPRIDLLKVDLSESNPNEGLVLIKVDYLIRATNTRYNFVYPFYKNEATNL